MDRQLRRVNNNIIVAKMRVERPLTALLLMLGTVMIVRSQSIATTHRADFTGLFQLTTDHSRHGLALLFHLREKPEEIFWLYIFSHPTLNLSCAISDKDLMLIDNIKREQQRVTNQTVDCNQYRVCTLYFSNVSNGYYCAQKLERPVTLYTITVNVVDPTTIVPMLILPPQEGEPLGVPLGVWLVGAAILVLVLNIAGWSYFRKQPTSTVPELPVGSQRESQQAPLLPPISGVRLFVVYVKDEQCHLDMVVTLVNLFRSLFRWEVVVDYECKDHISTLGPSVWVLDAISRANKVLFISSEGAHRLVQTLITRTQMPNDENQPSENVFLFAWRIVSSNMQLCDKYNKIYNIRFRSTNARFLTQVIVKGRHFVIPTHLPQLAYQLTTSGQEKDPKKLENKLENTIKSSPFYSRLVTAVLPIKSEMIDEVDREDFTWISPGS